MIFQPPVGLNLSIGEAASALANQRVKKDALWKPLLRGFRIYLRRSLQIFLDINQIYDGSGDLSQKAQEACKKFIKSVGAPEHI